MPNFPMKFFFDFLKLAPKSSWTVFMVCAILLFSPASLQQILGTTSFVDNYRQWIGFVLIMSFSVWSTPILIKLFHRFQNNRNVKQRLKNLTEPEKQILRYYVELNTRSNRLRMDNGDVHALVKARILYSSRSGYIITDLAWDFIHKNPHLLKGETDYYYTDEQVSNWPY